MKKIYAVLFLLLNYNTLQAQIVNIPDANFKNALLNYNPRIDTNSDGEIQVSEALTVDSLNVSYKSISNLEGIASFSNLRLLYCYYNQLTALDISSNINLRELNCGDNPLNTLNVSNNTALTYLNCRNNLLTDLDVSANTSLANLYCYNNQLTTLDVSSNTALSLLHCYNNQLSSLNLTNNTVLDVLNCSNNLLSNLDLSNNTRINSLDCSYNNLTELNVSNKPWLDNLFFDHNQISSINLDDLFINRTSTVDINIVSGNFNLITELNLKPIHKIRNLSFKNNLIANANLSNSTVYDLRLNSNRLTSISLDSFFQVSASNTKYLFIDYNNITNLKIPLTYKGYISAGRNQLDSLEVNTNYLQGLNVSGNLLNSLNLTSLDSINDLMCSDNRIHNISMDNLQIMNSFIANNNLLTNLTNFKIHDRRIPSNSRGFELNLSNNLIQNIEINYEISGTKYFSCLNRLKITLDNNDLRTLNIKDLNSVKGSPNILSPSDTCRYISLNNNPNLQYICVKPNLISSMQYIVNRTTGITPSSVAINSYCSFTPGDNFNTIIGNVKYDEFNDGCNSSDSSSTGIRITLNDNANFGTTYTNSNGNFTFYTDSTNLIITPVLPSPYFTISPTTTNITFPDANNHVAIQNFCLTPNGVHNDVEVNLIPLNPARPGFDATYKLIYKNKGNQIESGTVRLNFDDSVLDFIQANISPDIVNTGDLSWNYSNLLPLESREIIITMNTNSPMETPPVNNGDILRFIATINPIQNDETPLDNTFELNQTVVNSFDPNDKTCTEGNYIDRTQVGDYLHYVIRFENTGTAEAINIVVVDTIDVNKFNISTLVPISASHNYITRIKDNKVEFIFENINLPFDDANNDGYVAFKIKTKSNLTLNTNIQNSASIYFDYNFPIVTNRTSTVVSNLTNIVNINKEIFAEISPNPAKDIAQIQCSEPIVSLSISDLSGKTLQQITSKNNIKSLAIANLSKGVYFVKINTNKGFKVLRLLKE